jgi:DNA-binding transcriptional regulator of glucitol operon
VRRVNVSSTNPIPVEVRRSSRGAPRAHLTPAVVSERRHSVSVVGVKGGVLARRAGIIALCVLSLAVCVGLAWWQWQRFENGGTWQNLGYVLQWPLFGLFPAFMFWRLRKLRAQTAEAEPELAPARVESHLTPPPEPDKSATRQDAAQDDDPELAAYNRMLAQLNARDQQETR